MQLTKAQKHMLSDLANGCTLCVSGEVNILDAAGHYVRSSAFPTFHALRSAGLIVETSGRAGEFYAYNITSKGLELAQPKTE